MPIKAENKKLYPKNWKRIREEVLERAGMRCECHGECGFTHISRDGARCYKVHLKKYDAVRCVLTIAHLNHNPRFNLRSNLRAMCQGCHLRYDAEHHQKSAAETRRRK